MKQKKVVIGLKYLLYYGCATQGDSFDELLSNIYEAVEGCLSVDVQDITISEKDKIIEIAVWNQLAKKDFVAFLKAKGSGIETY